jgi:hypothetical protein
VDPVTDALEEVRHAITANIAVGEQILQRIDELATLREAGRSWGEIVTNEQHPLVVELLAANFGRLSTAGARLRRAQARALHDEGMTMEQIATAFGVTRQRVSALLRER